VEQCRLAVEGGYAAANVSLGLCYEKGGGVPRSDPAQAARLYALAAEGGTAGKTAFDTAMAVLPDNVPTPGVPSAAALARTRHAVYQLNLAARLGHVAAAQQLEALAGRRDVVSAYCLGCGAVRELKTCSKCRVARVCDMGSTTRVWPAPGAQGELQGATCQIRGQRDCGLRAASDTFGQRRYGAGLKLTSGMTLQLDRSQRLRSRG
jgi:hypothetical protein